MGDRLCPPLAFDPARLLADPARLLADLARLDARPWTAHFVPEHCLGNWSVLPLRVPVGAMHPIMQIAPNPTCRDRRDTELLAACAYSARWSVRSPARSRRCG